MQKICLSTSINTWFSIRSSDWPRQEQLCRWHVLTACRRYDVTSTNLWCMIMNEFPVCVFACRVVDCVNLFTLRGFRFKLPRPGLELDFWIDVLMSTQIFKPQIILLLWWSDLNTDPADINHSAEHCAASALHKIMNGRGFKVCWLSDCVHPEGKLKSPSMHTGPWVKRLTYNSSLVAACVAGIGWANEISVVLKAVGSRWMDGSIMTDFNKA